MLRRRRIGTREGGAVCFLPPRRCARRGRTRPRSDRKNRADATPVVRLQVECIDGHEGRRHLALPMFYPAALRDRSAARFVMPFFANLKLYKDAEAAFDGTKRPLVMFSHGRSSNGLYYAWF